MDFWRLLFPLFIILESQQLLDTLECISTLFTVVLCGQLFGAKPGRMCFDTVLNARYRPPICTVYSLNRRGDTVMCNFSAFNLNDKKSLQTGWHCTYLTSTHWHGNPAAFSGRCHFPTSSPRVSRSLLPPGVSHWLTAGGMEGIDGWRRLRRDAGCSEVSQVCRMTHKTLWFINTNPDK